MFSLAKTTSEVTTGSNTKWWNIYYISIV